MLFDMYLRRYGKKVDGEEYGYWTPAESVRTARGPRQRVVATTGKLPDFDKEERFGREEIGRILTGKPQPQDSLVYFFSWLKPLITCKI